MFSKVTSNSSSVISSFRQTRSCPMRVTGYRPPLTIFPTVDFATILVPTKHYFFGSSPPGISTQTLPLAACACSALDIALRLLWLIVTCKSASYVLYIFSYFQKLLRTGCLGEWCRSQNVPRHSVCIASAQNRYSRSKTCTTCFPGMLLQKLDDLANCLILVEEVAVPNHQMCKF